MDLLLFFALPVATVILAIVWQKIIKCPILVAATAFAIYLIVTFAAFDSSFLIYAIIYTILAFIAAWLTKFICQTFGRNGFFGTINAENINTNNLNTNTLEINDDDSDDNNTNGCGCGCNRYSYNRNQNNYRRYR